MDTKLSVTLPDISDEDLDLIECFIKMHSPDSKVLIEKEIPKTPYIPLEPVICNIVDGEKHFCDRPDKAHNGLCDSCIKDKLDDEMKRNLSLVVKEKLLSSAIKPSDSIECVKIIV